MVGYFDKALLNKIKKVWPNTIYANTAVTYNAVYSGGNSPVEGQLKFPLINIYRPDGYQIVDSRNLAARLQGYDQVPEIVELENEEKLLVTTRFLYANLSYQLNIYAKTLEELDRITNDLITMFSLNPSLEVVQYADKKILKEKYGQLKEDSIIKYEDTYYLEYSRGPVEQSTFDDGDRIYTYALAYNLSHAKLANFKVVPLIKDVDLIVYADETGINVDGTEIELDTDE